MNMTLGWSIDRDFRQKKHGNNSWGVLYVSRVGAGEKKRSDKL